MNKAFNLAFSVLKKSLSLQPSPSHMDEDKPTNEMRHFKNMERYVRRFDVGKDFGSQVSTEEPLPPHEEMPLRNVGTTSYGANQTGLALGRGNTLPPNPSRQLPQPRPVDTSSPKALQIKETFNPDEPMTDDALRAMFTRAGMPIQKAWQIIRR